MTGTEAKTISTACGAMDDLWTPEQSLPGGRVLRCMVERCAQAWSLPELTRRTTIGYNPRLRTTLGRAFFETMRVELNPHLLRAHPAELVDTVVHELAHLAAKLRYGAVAPHGQHFRALVRAMNCSPGATHDLPVKRLARRRGRYLYLHRCTDCGYRFVAGKVRRNVYCATCGPEMTWDIVRAPNSPAGKKLLTRLKNASQT